MPVQFKNGYMYAYLTVLLWAMYNIIAKVSVTYGVHPAIFVCIGSLAASTVLFQISGMGALSFSTLKQPRTILYSLCNLLEHVFTLYLFTYVAGTAGSLMQRLNIGIALFIAIFIMGRKQTKANLIGTGIVLTGVAVVIANVDPAVKGPAIVWLVLAVLCQTIKTFIIEQHPDSNEAKGYKEQARVTAFVTFVTTVVFLAFLVFMALVKEYSGIKDPIIEHLPSLMDFLHPTTFLAGIIFGIVNDAPAGYCYFYATKAVKTEKFLAIAAFVPLFTFMIEFILYKLGIVDMSKFTDHALFAISLIIIGSLITAIKGHAKKEPTLAPKAKAELEVLRDTIRTTMMCFNDDMDKVSKALGIGKRTIKQVMETDKHFSKDIKNKIIFGHAQNVVGLDHLTGALNKTSFDIELEKISNSDKAIVMFVDLDKFKPINDAYGHDAGDAILKGVAERLIEEFQYPNVVARLGGDEYCLIINNASKSDIDKYSKKVKDLVTNSFIIQEAKEPVSVGCSIGAAHYPTDSENGLELKTIADNKMYKDKESKGDVR